MTLKNKVYQLASVMLIKCLTQLDTKSKGVYLGQRDKQLMDGYYIMTTLYKKQSKFLIPLYHCVPGKQGLQRKPSPPTTSSTMHHPLSQDGMGLKCQNIIRELLLLIGAGALRYKINTPLCL